MLFLSPFPEGGGGGGLTNRRGTLQDQLVYRKKSGDQKIGFYLLLLKDLQTYRSDMRYVDVSIDAFSLGQLSDIVLML